MLLRGRSLILHFSPLFWHFSLTSSIMLLKISWEDQSYNRHLQIRVAFDYIFMDQLGFEIHDLSSSWTNASIAQMHNFKIYWKRKLYYAKLMRISVIMKTQCCCYETPNKTAAIWVPKWLKWKGEVWVTRTRFTDYQLPRTEKGQIMK